MWVRVSLHVFLIGKTNGMLIDHRDNDGLNNTRKNLRLATHSQNLQNAGPDSKRKTSRFKGVSWSKGMKKWLAQIMANRKHSILGYFASEEEAARAYDAAARRLHGEFAYANYPEKQNA